jgi:membrane protease YdiL (CAAX protease family)
MMGLIVELILSWILLWLFSKSNLLVLGISPTKPRAYNLLAGFLIASVCCFFYYWSMAALSGSHLEVNKDFGVPKFFKSSWWVLNSVLFEEFIFRGALLYIAIKMLGARNACILSAIAFGIYHWFSYGAFGNIGQMLIIFIMTGIWGLMFAYAFAKTKSMYLPIGLHFGWNLVNTVVFSQGPIGQQLLIATSNKKPEVNLSLLYFILQIVGVPILVYLYLRTQKKGHEYHR